MQSLLTLQSLLTTVIGLVSGGLGAWFVTRFTNVVDRFFTQKFDQRIELFKSRLEREVEELKARLGHFTDRGIRSNQLEYDAITTAWAKLDTAYRSTNAAIVRFYEHPDFNKMQTDQLERFFATSQLSEDGKDYIRQATDKNAAWGRTEDLRLINLAGTAIYEVNETLSTKGIFIPKELEDEFRAALDICSKGWAWRKTDFSRGQHSVVPGANDATIDFFEKAPKKMEEVKEKVRTRILAPYSNQ